MIRLRPHRLTLLGLLSLLALLAGCSGGSNGSLGAARGALLDEDGPIALVADPAEVVIDLNDENTPVDPGTNKAYGESALTATVLDDLAAPQAGVEVVFTTTGGSLASAGAPLTTDDQGQAGDTLRLLEDDPDSVEVTATAGEDSMTITVTKRVIPLNQPPVADAGGPQTAECGNPVTLDGSGSSDPDSTDGTNDDIESFEWFLGGDRLGEGETLEVTLPLGEHVVTLTVTDEAGASASDETTVTVQDTRPPTVEIELDPAVIWPPNHKMVEVWATVRASDRCTADPLDLVYVLLSVESNEPDDGLGDGNTEPDVMGAEAGTEDYGFSVRAERSGGGSGRVYTVKYRVTDPSGNPTEASAEVRVPHDRGD